MNIGEAAKKSGLTVKTVRYYDEINLINKINFASVSGFPSLEELKETTVLPLDYV